MRSNTRVLAVAQRGWDAGIVSGALGAAAWCGAVIGYVVAMMLPSFPDALQRREVFLSVGLVSGLLGVITLAAWTARRLTGWRSAHYFVPAVALVAGAIRFLPIS